MFLSFATNAFATSNNLFNVTRNFTFVAIIALGMTIVIITGGIDLSVGSVLCLCSMILAVVMHAGYSIEVGILASLGTALAGRRLQRRTDRLSRISRPSWSRSACCRSRAAWPWSPPTTPWCSSSVRTTTSCCRSAAAPGCSASPIRCIYMIVLALITGFVLRLTRFGRYIFAIGGNEHAAT